MDFGPYIYAEGGKMSGHSKTQPLEPRTNAVWMCRGIPQNTGDRRLSGVGQVGSPAGRTCNNLRWNGREFIGDKIWQAAGETLQVVQTHERRFSGYDIPVGVCRDDSL